MLENGRWNQEHTHGPADRGGGGFFLDDTPPRKKPDEKRRSRGTDRRTPRHQERKERAQRGPENYPVPATALDAARSFYLNRGAHRFVIDVPYKDVTTEARYRRSLGDALSMVLVSKAPQYSELKEELGKPAEDERALDQLKVQLLLAVEHAARFASKPLTPEQKSYVETQFISQITEEFLTQAVKTANARAKTEKKKEVEDLKAAAKRIAQNQPLGLLAPPMPDDFSRAQRELAATILEDLRAPDGTSIPDFLQTVSEGSIKEVVPTGLWRSRKVDDAIAALDESTDIAAKRNAVESFLMNIPIIARNAIRSRESITPEQKERVMLAAEILYTRGQNLRTERLKMDSKTVAAETARLNENAARVYKTLFKMRILPPLRNPVDIEPRRDDEDDDSYDERIEHVVSNHKHKERKDAERFSHDRKPLIVEHLLAFMDRLDSDSDMNGIFPGTLGVMLSSSGERGRVTYRKLREEILARPVAERYYKRQAPLPSTEGHPAYVITDPERRALMQPPERMRTLLDKAYEGIEAAQETIGEVRKNISNLIFEAKSAWQTDLDLLAKRLDVLEADMQLPAAWSALQGAYEILKDRGEPGSFTWRSTMDVEAKSDKLAYGVRDAQFSLDAARRELVKKYIGLARDQIKAVEGGEDTYAELVRTLNEFEVVARDPKASREQLIHSLNFFANAN